MDDEDRESFCIARRSIQGETVGEFAATGSGLISIMSSSSLSIIRTRSCNSESLDEQTLERTRLRHASLIDGADVGGALTGVALSSLIENEEKSGEAIISPSSMIVIGSVAVPPISFAVLSTITGSLAFRHVANLAKQAGFGALVEAVETEEMDELREEREKSEIMDSGLDPEETAEGARDDDRLAEVGRRSIVMRQKVFCCTEAIALHMLGRRDVSEPRTLTAGVLEAIDDGVNWGVGSGPMRANAGVGGRGSALGSR